MVIEARRLRFSYPGAPATLKDVDLTAEAGEMVLVTGASGAGKTTLFRLLVGSLSPTGGTLTVDGVNMRRASPEALRTLRRRMGVIFQDFRLLSGKSALENVEVSLTLLGVPERTARVRAAAALAKVGLSASARQDSAALSFGQQQRVAFARALVRSPALILADEPTANLDDKTAEAVSLWLKQAHATGATVLVITHDARLEGHLGGRKVALEDGKVVRPAWA